MIKINALLVTFITSLIVLAAVLVTLRPIKIEKVVGHHVSGAGKPFDPSLEPLRIRKDFYDLSDEELRLFMKAVGYMRNELKLEDPIQWDNYAKVHAFHCTQADASHPPVHWSWHFLPWHRGYLYFLERILANCLDRQGLDGSKFSLPYWDWTTHKGMPNTRERVLKGLPSPFFGYDPTLEDMVNNDGLGFDNSALYDGNRGPSLAKPQMDPDNEVTEDSKTHVRETLHYMSKEYVEYMLSTPFEIFGGKPVTDRQTGQGLLEQGPHNDGHDWVGTRFGKNRTMGTLRTAASDPMFYMHHGNIDRIWSLYRLPQPDPSGPYGDQEYDFYDVDGGILTLSVREILAKTVNVAYAPPQTQLSSAGVTWSKADSIKINQILLQMPLEFSIPKDFGSGLPILAEVHTGPIFSPERYSCRIYAGDTLIGKINFLDGEHRKHHTKLTMDHTFCLLMTKIPAGTTKLRIIPPAASNLQILIKSIDYHIIR